MPLDLLFPFGILVALVIYLIYTRNTFEKRMLTTYEDKFEEWKKHTPVAQEKEVCKELIGLAFKKDGKIEVEVFDELHKTRLEKGKFTIKVK